MLGRELLRFTDQRRTDARPRHRAVTIKSVIFTASAWDSSLSDAKPQARKAITRGGAVAKNKRPVFRLSIRQSFST
jgi:hypothetical protein